MGRDQGKQVKVRSGYGNMIGERLGAMLVGMGAMVGGLGAKLGKG